MGGGEFSVSVDIDFVATRYISSILSLKALLVHILDSECKRTISAFVVRIDIKTSVTIVGQSLPRATGRKTGSKCPWHVRWKGKVALFCSIFPLSFFFGGGGVF